MLGQLVALHFGVVVDLCARLDFTLDDGRVRGDDECLLFLGRVEHLPVAAVAQGSCTLFTAVALDEVDDEPDDPREANEPSGHDARDHRSQRFAMVPAAGSRSLRPAHEAWRQTYPSVVDGDAANCTACIIGVAGSIYGLLTVWLI